MNHYAQYTCKKPAPLMGWLSFFAFFSFAIRPGVLSRAPALLHSGLQYAGRGLVLAVQVPQIAQRRVCLFMVSPRFHHTTN